MREAKPLLGHVLLAGPYGLVWPRHMDPRIILLLILHRCRCSNEEWAMSCKLSLQAWVKYSCL